MALGQFCMCLDLCPLTGPGEGLTELGSPLCPTPTPRGEPLYFPCLSTSQDQPIQTGSPRHTFMSEILEPGILGSQPTLPFLAP